MAMKMTLKAKLSEPGRLLNWHVCVIPSAVVTQAVAAAGADGVIIDQEHGPIGFDTLHAMIAATQGFSCAPLVRVPEISEVHVKRALDAGAEESVSRSFAPPPMQNAASPRCDMRHWKRGWGRCAHSRWGTQLFHYVAGPGQETVCMLLIETVDAVENIDQICEVEGIDY